MPFTPNIKDRELDKFDQDSVDQRSNVRVTLREVLAAVPVSFNALTDIGGTNYLNIFSNWPFLSVGNNIQASYPDDVTEVYQFKHNTTLVVELTVTYQDAEKDVLLSCERTA